jgi:hypothetical protein
MMHKRAETDTVNPPGQVTLTDSLPQTLQKNIEQWQRWADDRKSILHRCEPCVWGGKLCDGSCNRKE